MKKNAKLNKKDEWTHLKCGGKINNFYFNATFNGEKRGHLRHTFCAKCNKEFTHINGNKINFDPIADPEEFARSEELYYKQYKKGGQHASKE